MSTSIYTPSLNDEIFSYPKSTIEYDDSDSTPFWTYSEAVTGELNPMYNQTHTDEAKERIGKSSAKRNKGEGNPFFGKTHSPELWAQIGKNISLANTGKTRGKYNTTGQYNAKYKTCPHCNLVGRGGVMGRYHFDNCKEK